ncbi:Uncharacterized protein QTN25_006654 [Entamoeba marina]
MFVSVTAPKRIPVLKYTADYFMNAYNYNHSGIVIDGMFLTKGCNNCNYPLFDEVYNAYHEAGMNPVSTNISYPQILSTNNSWNHMERYHPYYTRQRNKNHSQKIHKKCIIVNHYTHLTGIKAFEMFPTADYIIFLEDDVAIYKNFFTVLKELLDNFDENKYSLLKLATPSNKKSNGIVLRQCIWGWWGIVMTKQQFERYIKYSTYSEYTDCGDTLVCNLANTINLHFKVNRVMYHFGRQKKIQPRMEKYYNGFYDYDD